MRQYVAVLVVLVILLSAFSCTLASEENLPARGTKQLMFGFSDWTLSGYDGGAGLRTYLRDNLSMRFTLDFGWSDGSEEAEQTIHTTRDTEESRTTVGLGAVIERHFQPAWNVVPFVGGGLFGTYETSTHKRTYSGDNYACFMTDRSGYSGEARLIGGLQWHVTRNLSLGGEYSISFRYSWYERVEQKISQTVTEEIRYTTRSFASSVDVSKLWLSLSF